MQPATLYLEHVLPRLTVGGGAGAGARGGNGGLGAASGGRGAGAGAGAGGRGGLISENLGRATSLRLLEEFQTLVRQNPALLDVAKGTTFIPNAEGRSVEG